MPPEPVPFPTADSRGFGPSAGAPLEGPPSNGAPRPAAPTDFRYTYRPAEPTTAIEIGVADAAPSPLESMGQLEQRMDAAERRRVHQRLVLLRQASETGLFDLAEFTLECIVNFQQKHLERTGRSISLGDALAQLQLVLTWATDPTHD